MHTNAALILCVCAYKRNWRSEFCHHGDAWGRYVSENTALLSVQVRDGVISEKQDKESGAKGAIELAQARFEQNATSSMLTTSIMLTCIMCRIFQRFTLPSDSLF